MANEPFRLTQTGPEVQEALNDIEALGLATEETAGKMSAADKQKLDGIESGAEANTISTVKVNGTALTPDANKAVDIDTKRVLELKSIPATGTYTEQEFEEAVCSLTDFQKATDGGYTLVKVPISGTGLFKAVCPVASDAQAAQISFVLGTNIYKISVLNMMGVQVTTIVTPIPTALSQLSEDTTHRVVTDAEKTAWNGKADKSDTPRVVSFEYDLDELPSEIIEELRLGDIVSCLGDSYEVMHKTPTEIRLSMGDWFYEFIKSNGVWSYSQQGADLYRKPTTGIPASDLAQAVQTSLGKADSSIQTVKVNGTALTPDINKAVDVTVPDVSEKMDKVSGGTAGNFAILNAGGGVGDSGKKPSDMLYFTPSGEVDPSVTPADYATRPELEQLSIEVNGSNGRVDTVTNFSDTEKFLYGTGTLGSSNYNITDFIDIENCTEIILIKVWATQIGILSYVIYDASKNILATNPAPGSDGEQNYDLTSFPEGTKYIRCSQNYLSNSSVEVHYDTTPGLKGRVEQLEIDSLDLEQRVSDLEDEQLDINIQDTITAKNQITDFTTYSDTHLNTANGQTASSTSFICSDFVPILPETDYTCGKIDASFGGFKVWTMQEICYYDESKAFLSAATSKQTITSPSGAKFLRFSVLSTTYSESLGTDSISELEIVQGASPISVFGRGVFGNILPLNGLKGKKWLVIGDSNTEHNFRANGKYDEFIASYTGVVPMNIGVSGAGFRVYENADYVYLNILNAFITNNPTYKPDFITIMGGTNDVNFDGANIGTYTDETSATVFGYMYLLVQRIKEAYPNVPFAICTQFPQNYGDASKQTLLTSFVQGEMDFCKYRNIPCLDLFFCSGLRPEESGFNAHYYSCSTSPNGDGIHLNYYGQKLISARIREFLLSYFGEF